MATEARDRIAARERVEQRRRQVEAPSTVRDDSEDEMVVSFPEFVFKEFIVAVAMTVFLIIVSIWLQAPLLGKANPGMTPNPSKAPWYFLGLQELLSRFPPLMAGVAFPTFVIVLMILVHELGHFFTWRNYGVKASLPTFIPGFGAFVSAPPTGTPAQNVAAALAGPVFGVAAAAVLAGVIFAQRITRPVNALMSVAERVGRGDLSQLVAVTSRDELGQMAVTFNDSIVRLR